MDAPLRAFPLPHEPLIRLLGAAVLALAAQTAEAQPDALWSGSGEISMTYREQAGGTVYGRNASNIHETIETDIISTIEVGGVSGPSDDDPGSLSLSNVGDDEAPRDLGDVDVNVGTLSLNDSIVSGRFAVTRPTSVMTMLLSELRSTSVFTVSTGGTFTAQVSHVAISVREGGIARISGCTGSVGSTIGADVEIDSSTLGSSGFRGKQVVTNSTITGPQGSIREGESHFDASSLDVVGDLTVGGNTTSAPPTDTDLIMTSSVFESGTGAVRAGVGLATTFEMRGASTWRSFGPFAISNPTTQADINSGSRIDARADFILGGSFVTIGSTTATSSRIDVAGDFDLAPTIAGTLTIEDGGVVDVDGTLVIGPLATLNLNGGTLRVGALDNSQGGVLNENGGTLIVPEPASAAALVAASLALAGLRRRRR